MKQILSLIFTCLACYVFFYTYISIISMAISPAVFTTWFILYVIAFHILLIVMYRKKFDAVFNYIAIALITIINYAILFFYNPDALISAGLL